MGDMDVLSSRTLLRPSEPSRSHRFYRDTLGLAIYREFGSPDTPGLVFFLGNGLLEVSGRATDPPGDAIALWIQVRDVHAASATAGRRCTDSPRTSARGVGAGGDVDHGSGWSSDRHRRSPGPPSAAARPTPPCL